MEVDNVNHQCYNNLIMNKTLNAVVINPEGVKLSDENILHYGHTTDVLSNHTFSNGSKGFIVQPHGYEHPYVITESDLKVYNNE